MSFSGFSHNSFCSITKHEKIKTKNKFGECLLPIDAASLFFSFCVYELEGSNYKIITLPVVLYGCKTWSRILWDEIRLRVFENELLRNTYGL